MDWIFQSNFQGKIWQELSGSTKYETKTAICYSCNKPTSYCNNLIYLLVGGFALLRLNDEDLSKNLNISVIGHRIAFSEALYKLKQENKLVKPVSKTCTFKKLDCSSNIQYS
jgi:hypothetical protein